MKKQTKSAMKKQTKSAKTKPTTPTRKYHRRPIDAEITDAEIEELDRAIREYRVRHADTILKNLNANLDLISDQIARLQRQRREISNSIKKLKKAKQKTQ